MGRPWDFIIKQLNELAAEELITIQQPRSTICITEKGMEKAVWIDSIYHNCLP